MWTAKSIALIIAVLLLLVIAWNTDITLVYILFLASFLLFVGSFIILQLNIVNLQVTRYIEETAFEDEMLDVGLIIENKRTLPNYLFEVVDNFSCGPPDERRSSIFILRLAGFEKLKLSYIGKCYKRGLWKIGPITVNSQDYLGFFKMKKSLNVISEILVYPKIFRILNFPPLARGSVSWLGVETAKISGDSHEFYGVREYQRGDAISRIHWPSSARLRELIVRQFERSAVQEVTLVLDLKKGHDIGTGKETTLEYAVKIGASICRYLIDIGALVQIIAYGKEPIMLHFGKGESHMYQILEELAKVQADGMTALKDVLEEANFITPYNSTLILIMLDIDRDALSSLIQFKVKGIRLIVVVLSSATFGVVSEEFLEQQGIREFEEALANLEAYQYRIAKGDDLEKKFETV